MTFFCFDPSFNWGTIIQLLGIIGAIWGVTHQLRKQRDLQKEKYTNELKIKIYEQIVAHLEDGNPTGIAATLSMFIEVLDDKRKTNNSSRYIPPPFSPDQIHSDFKKVQSNLFKTASLIENYEIVSPNIPLFRQILVNKISELGTKYMPFIQIMPYLLLSDDGIKKPENLLIPNDNEIDLLRQKVNEFMEVSWDIASYLYDIRVELQNILLSDFFNNRVSQRKPKDPDAIVLTSEDSGMLKRIEDYLKQQEKDINHR
ncbi:MAG: hypothetical protein B5M56_09740 [Desulfococcus sp. 4484_241]|nr:MAG: hypothetical protein B5M56_09740 [Desulfococcus sp. 4484_241]